jgi:hypothetical protein
VAGGCGILCNEEPHNSYNAPSIIKAIKSRMRWAGNVERMVQMHKNSVRKLERKRPLGRPGLTWEHNIRIDVMEIGWEFVDWIHLDQDRDQWWGFVVTVMNLRIP